MQRYSYTYEKDLAERFGVDDGYRAFELAQVLTRVGAVVFTDSSGARIAEAVENLEKFGYEPVDEESAPIEVTPTDLEADYTLDEIVRVRKALTEISDREGERALFLRSVFGLDWDTIAADADLGVRAVRSRAKKMSDAFSVLITGRDKLAGCGEHVKSFPKVLFGLYSDKSERDAREVTVMLDHLDSCDACRSDYVTVRRAIEIAGAFMPPRSPERLQLPVVAEDLPQTDDIDEVEPETATPAPVEPAPAEPAPLDVDEVLADPALDLADPEPAPRAEVEFAVPVAEHEPETTETAAKSYPEPATVFYDQEVDSPSSSLPPDPEPDTDPLPAAAEVVKPTPAPLPAYDGNAAAPIDWFGGEEFLGTDGPDASEFPAAPAPVRSIAAELPTSSDRGEEPATEPADSISEPEDDSEVDAEASTAAPAILASATIAGGVRMIGSDSEPNIDDRSTEPVVPMSVRESRERLEHPERFQDSEHRRGREMENATVGSAAALRYNGDGEDSERTKRPVALGIGAALLLLLGVVFSDFLPGPAYEPPVAQSPAPAAKPAKEPAKKKPRKKRQHRKSSPKPQAVRVAEPAPVAPAPAPVSDPPAAPSSVGDGSSEFLPEERG